MIVIRMVFIVLQKIFSFNTATNHNLMTRPSVYIIFHYADVSCGSGIDINKGVISWIVIDAAVGEMDNVKKIPSNLPEI